MKLLMVVIRRVGLLKSIELKEFEIQRVFQKWGIFSISWTFTISQQPCSVVKSKNTAKE